MHATKLIKIESYNFRYLFKYFTILQLYSILSVDCLFAKESEWNIQKYLIYVTHVDWIKIRESFIVGGIWKKTNHLNIPIVFIAIILCDPERTPAIAFT